MHAQLGTFADTMHPLTLLRNLPMLYIEIHLWFQCENIYMFC